jgi:predicted oxidoreductase
MSVEDKNFLLEIEDLFNKKIEEYDKALSQISPEFRCTIDNYSIKFHKPNDVIGEPENMGDSHNQIILPFNLRLDYNEDIYILHQPGELIDDETLNSNNKILIEYGGKVPSNL